MLSIAFVSGLRKMGRVLTSPTLKIKLIDPTPPAAGTPTIKRGDTLKYEIDVTNAGGVTFQRWIELVTGTVGSGEMMFRTLAAVTPSSGSTPATFEVHDFRHSAQTVTLAIQLLAKKGNVTGVVVADPVQLDVID